MGLGRGGEGGGGRGSGVSLMCAMTARYMKRTDDRDGSPYRCAEIRGIDFIMICMGLLARICLDLLVVGSGCSVWSD